MCDIDLEQCELWSEEDIKARTPKICASCDGAINPGDMYVKHFSKFEGETTSEVMCFPCKSDRAEFAGEHDGMSPTPGYFPTMLSECISDEDETEVGDEPKVPLEPWPAMMKRMEARAAARVVNAK